MKPVIFIPTYNSEKYLPRTLDSLVAQKGVDKFPIIVVDNNSTDNTRKIARKYKNVEVFRNKEDIGRVPNWNKCLELFKEQEAFDCMKFVFAGDTLKPRCLEIQLDHLNKATPIVTCAHKVVQEGNNYIMRHFDTQKVFTPKQSLKEAYKRGNWIAGSTACPLFTKEVLGDTRFNTRMIWAADWLFWTMLSEKANIRYLDASLVQFTMEARKGYKKWALSNEASAEEIFIKNYIGDSLLINSV